MKMWPVATSYKSDRSSFLKMKYPTRYFPKTRTKDDSYNRWPESTKPSTHRPLSKQSIAKTSRPHTSLGINRSSLISPRSPSPDHLHRAFSTEDIEDLSHSAEPSYVFGLTEPIHQEPPTTYVHELSSRLSNAKTDYEIRTANRTGDAMNRGMYTPRVRSRSMSPSRTRPFVARAYTMDPDSMMAIPGTYYSQWDPFVTSPRYGESCYNMNPQIDYQLPMPMPQLIESRPRTRHRRRNSFSQGYVHDGSCFSFTKPHVTGHYIINPDWVSERLSTKPPPARQFRPKGLRY